MCSPLRSATVSELLQSGLELDNALAPNKTERHTQISIDMNLSAFSLLVCCIPGSPHITFPN